MKNKGLNKVDLIFEKVDPKEVLLKAFSMSPEEIIQEVNRTIPRICSATR